MCIWQEGVDRVPDRIEPECVSAGFRPNSLQTTHPVRLEHLDQPRVADRDIEMPPFLVEKEALRVPEWVILGQI